MPEPCSFWHPILAALLAAHIRPDSICRCGTAALVSFAFGAVVEQGSVTQLPRALAGIGCLLLGVGFVAWSGSLQQAIAERKQTSRSSRAAGQHGAPAAPPASDGQREVPEVQQPLLDDPEDAAVGSGQHTGQQINQGGHQPDHMPDIPQHQQQQHRKLVLGLLLAVLTGVLGGLILAPMDYVGRECRGVPYQAALAVGVLAAAPVVTYCLHWLNTGKVRPTIPGMLQAYKALCNWVSLAGRMGWKRQIM